MKKLKLIFLFSLVALAIGCDEDQVIFDNNNGSSLTAFGSVGQNLSVAPVGDYKATIRVDVTTVSNVDRTVVFNVDAAKTTATPAMYTIDTPTVVIPAGAYNAEIVITGHYDQIPANLKFRLVLDLVSLDGSTVSAANDEHTIILSQACPKGFEVGNYDVSVLAFDEEAPAHVQNLVAVTEGAENTYSMASSWGVNFVSWATGDDYDGQYVYPINFTINCDNTVTAVGTDAGGTYDTGGAGTYDVDSGVVTIVLGQGLFTGGDPVTITITPQP